MRHIHGVGQADLSGLLLSQHFFHASTTAVLFTLHQPGRTVGELAQPLVPSAPCIVFVTSVVMAACTLSSCCVTVVTSGGMCSRCCATRESSCRMETSCALEDAVLVTP